MMATAREAVIIGRATAGSQPPTAAELVRALQCSRDRCRCHRSARDGHGLVHCPAHDDANPSLSVREADDGRTLVRCHAGCDQDAVIAALRARKLWPDPATEQDDEPVTVVRTTRYPIHDDAGRLVAYHVRRDLSNGGKSFVWQQPDGTPGLGGRRTASLPLYGVHELGDAPAVIVVEGEKARDVLHQLGFAAVGTVTGASSTPSDDALRPLVGRRVILWPDADDPGRSHMQRIAARLVALGCEDVRVIRWAGALPGDDAADFVRRGGTADDVRTLCESADKTDKIPFVSFGRPIVEGVEGSEPESEASEPEWEPLRDLPQRTPAVPTLPPDMVPEPIRPWLTDIAERAVIPLEMPAVAALCGAGAVLGRAVGIRPVRFDDFIVVGNVWGAVVARPGMLKTHAQGEGLGPLYHLAATARQQYADQIDIFEARQDRIKAEIDALRDKLKEAVKKGGDTALLEAELVEKRRQLRESATTERRYLTHDATIEKLGQLLVENPRGLLLHRDELAGWFRTMDKPGREGDREFFLEAWNGTGSYTVDRIGRGTLHIPALTLSVVGGIQPGKLRRYIEEATSDGAGADGLLQRIQLLVWPDGLGGWEPVNREPDREARQAAYAVYEGLDRLDPVQIGATKDGDEIAYLRFDPAAQRVFDQWRTELEQRLRSEVLASYPAYESHIAKYRSLMPKLALIFHLMDCVAYGTAGPVSEEAARLAADWCDYLDRHARKVYAGELLGDVTAAHALAEKILDGSVVDRHPVRDIYRPGWRGLSSPERVYAGLDILAEHGWIRIETLRTRGRPSQVVRVHPKLRGGNDDRVSATMGRPESGRHHEKHD